ncbi:hypothetical protein B0H13DRAFT_2378354 [Mycena leptocephala]|nr:hypothetical protein B0H13DRAFT_2378354 [Mycena leptocephala]
MRYIVEVATANARRASSLRDPQAPRPPKRAGPSLDSGRSTKTARHRDTTVRRDTDVGTEEVGDEEIVDEFDKDPALLNYCTNQKASVTKFIEDYIVYLLQQVSDYKFPVALLGGQLVFVHAEELGGIIRRYSGYRPMPFDSVTGLVAFDSSLSGDPSGANIGVVGRPIRSHSQKLADHPSIPLVSIKASIRQPGPNRKASRESLWSQWATQAALERGKSDIRTDYRERRPR